jgi:hypothetical protein
MIINLIIIIKKLGNGYYTGLARRMRKSLKKAAAKKYLKK